MNPICDRCGKVNPDDIHTCTPKAAPVQEPVAWGIIASNTGRICQVELDAAEVEGHNPQHIVPLYATPPAAQPAPCTWTKSADPHMPDTFHSTCGVVWTFTDGGPGENNVRFCPGCGGKLVEGQP
jgi:hypothetical protein